MADFSVVVISQNEESNIGHCIGAAVRFSDDVWLVDSFSTDKTQEIAGKLGANVIEHEFESWGAQRNYALDNLKFKHEFILFMDADEQIDAAFADELEEKIQSSQYAAFNVNFDIVFLGKVLKYAHENLPVLRVIRSNAGRWVSEGAREYCIVKGPIGRIKARIRHEDRKGMFFWLVKHIRNADRDAKAILEKNKQLKLADVPPNSHFERPFRIVLRRICNRLPKTIKPFLIFIYRYFVRLGFLDGYPGLVFCLLQAFWYNLIIDARIFEIPLGYDNYLPGYGSDNGCTKQSSIPAEYKARRDLDSTFAGSIAEYKLMLPKDIKKANVLVLCQLFYPELISTGQTLTELCEELVRLGMDVEVVCGPPTVLDRDKKVAKHIEHKGTRIRRVWGTRFPKLNLIGRVINQITFAVSAFLYLLFHHPRKPILVLTNPPFLAVTCGILKWLKVGTPYIYLVFDVYPDTAVKLGVLKENGLLSRIWERLNCFVFKHASAIVVIGRCMEDVIAQKMKRCNLSINGKLHHISVWSDDKLIRSASERENPLKKKWELEDKFVIGYFGNMGRFHDMETIISAAEILKDNENICFLFVGEGHKKQATMEYAARHNLQNCQFHTYVDRQYLGYLMNLADVGVVSLLEGQEGLSVPSKALGLMAAGVPLVAVMSPKSEIARIIKEEGCGIVVKPGEEKMLADSILQLYNAKAQLKQMGVNALMAIREKYNLDKVSKKYFDLIEQVV